MLISFFCARTRFRLSCQFAIAKLPDPPQSIMAGLNCSTPSLVAWPFLSTGIDCFVAIEDEWAKLGMRV
ncbi:MAG: hypothetical protein JOZ18_21550 [Chloroflexi bacterium]|nr:hypothetical protein [Chloroflexota bacterium]